MKTKSAYALIPGEIFRPSKDPDYPYLVAGTAVWQRVTDIEELDNLRSIRIHTAEHGATVMPRYHLCYVQDGD